MRKWLLRFLVAGAAALIVAVGLILWVHLACQRAASGRLFHSVESVPANDVGLVLGTAPTTSRGNPNLHFQQRIEAAAKLFHAGKVRHLLVGGDNHRAGYDEPTDMRDALARLGVPTNAITCDYAGFRTLDTVVRANLVFGLTNLTIVTEEFHCPRALWSARQRGLNAVAFAAPDPPSRRWTLRVKAREVLARVLCGFDLYVLRTQPKFPGPPEPITLGDENVTARFDHGSGSIR
jgi:SanA protein